MKILGNYDFNHRQFLGNREKKGFAPSFSNYFPSLPLLGQPLNTTAHPNDREPISIELGSLNDSTEQKKHPAPKIIEPAKRVGYCIVGLGHLSLSQILPAFATSHYSRPVALVSGDTAKATKVAAQYGISPKNIYNYKNFDSIKDNKEIEVVYIALPNSLHEEYVIRAAAADKDILCEKPMATSTASAQRMIAACKKNARKLMIAYRIQYEPHNRIVKEWTRKNEFGKVKIIESSNGQNIGDPTQWRLKKALAGGGPLFDVGIYNINTARYILGQEPQWVFGSIFTTPNDQRFKEVEETVMFQLGFPNGVLMNGTTSYGVHKCRRYRCFTDKGAWYGLDPAFDYAGQRLELSQAKTTNEYKQAILMEEKNQFSLEMDHFSWCLLHNYKPFTPGEEGLQDQKIIEAIYQSAQEGKIIHIEEIAKIDAFRGHKPEN